VGASPLSHSEPGRKLAQWTIRGVFRLRLRSERAQTVRPAGRRSYASEGGLITRRWSAASGLRDRRESRRRRRVRLPPAPGRVLLAATVAREMVLEHAPGAVLAHVEERASAADAEKSDSLARARQRGEKVHHRAQSYHGGLTLV
jgi:hypothetical protein